MATTYSWHQGAVRLKSKWAVPTPLLPDEIFSSWLVRAAFDNGIEPMSLTGSIWPKSRLWSVDTDQNLSSKQIEMIAEYGGLSIAQVKASMLTWVVNQRSVFEASSKSMSPWILALGSRNRRRHGGMQYCPQCLAEDEIPYYRINWRFAWHVACDKHLCLLHDRCPHCQSAIHFHKRTFETPSHHYCALCHENLTTAIAQTAPLPALLLQNQTDKKIIENEATHDWFYRLRLFESLVRVYYKDRTQSIGRLFDLIGVTAEDFAENSLGLAFELLSTQERALYLSKIMQPISMPPDELLKHLMASGITKQAFCPKQIATPDSLREIIESLPNSARNHKVRSKMPSELDVPPPRSKREVERTFERLKRKMRSNP